MPSVLMQRAWKDDPKYKDTEFVVYHYPRAYFDEIRGGENFIYYRPASGAKREEASSYFGCGQLSDWWEDPYDATHRYVSVRKPISFAKPVPYEDPDGRMYESQFASRTPFQGRSVRYIDETDYQRILIAAGLTGAIVASAMTIDDVQSGRYSPLLPGSLPPVQALRSMDIVPEGTGYRPTGNPPDVYESAALQERARADHQSMVHVLKLRIEASGGKCLFNNNIDLLAEYGSVKYLIEVKSLSNPSSTVDRMRYGMGQLFDYSVRYRAMIGDAEPVLAFGAVPQREVGWVADILQGNDVAFVALDAGELRPMNDRAQRLPVFR